MPRIEVLKYAEAMERKLQENDEEKGSDGWKDCTIDFLLSKLDEETDELKDVAKGLAIFERAINIAKEYDDGITKEDIAGLKMIRDGIRRFLGKEAADVGNVAMFIADIFGALPELEKDKNRPQIVCLCGSTRFFKTFDEQNFKLTLEGYVVLTIGCNTKSDEGLKLTSEDKIRLDELHKRKIDLCDWVLVLDVDGYIGESTRSEISYAEKLGKPVKYLSKQ